MSAERLRVTAPRPKWHQAPLMRVTPAQHNDKWVEKLRIPEQMSKGGSDDNTGVITTKSHLCNC
jgi:hypothetical protein